MLAPSITNALTIDVEDYFQVSAFAPYIRRDEWDQRECRVERNVDRILELLAARQTQATFFTLGWVAERYPDMVRRIVAGGHELASHGYGHERASDLDRSAYRADLDRAKKVLEDIGGVPSAATAHRAFPSATATSGPSTRWPRPATRTAPASTRSSTTTTACPTPRASHTGARTACWRSR